MSALGQLVVSLIAETSQFRASMEKSAYVAQKNFNSIQSSAKGLLAGLGLYFSADMFVSWVKGAIDAADALNDLSQRTGIATDELSKLQYAAKLSDVSSEEFATNVIKLNRSIAETARGTGEAQKAFLALGISVKTSSGEIRDTKDILKDIADAFASYEDGANKTALATALFGRAGATFITFLNNGREGLDRFGAELAQMGGVIMPDAARKADELNDSIVRLRSSFGAAATEIGVTLAPYLTRLINEFLILKKNSDSFSESITTGIALGFRSTNLQDALAGVRKELEVISRYAPQYTIDSLKRQEAILLEAIQTQALADATRNLSAEEKRALEAKKKKPAPALAESKKATAPKSDEAEKLLERQALAVQKLTMSEEELAVAEVFLAGATMQQMEVAQRFADVLTKQRKEQEELKTQTALALDLYQEYKQLYEDTASPVQKLADEEARLLELRRRLVENGYEVIQVDRLIAEARLNAYDKFFPPETKSEILELSELSRELGLAISTSFEDAVIGGNNLRDVIRGLEEDIIRILMRKLVTQPLEAFVTDFGTQLFPKIFGARAMGGPVLANKSYLVGERGPEIFMPNHSGQIAPNHQLETLGNRINVTNNFVLNGPVDRRSQTQIATAVGLGLQRAVGRNT